MDGFDLVLVNEKNEILDSVRVFLSPDDPSQSLYAFGSSTPDDELVSRLIPGALDFFGMSPGSITVKTGMGSYSDVQLVKMELQTEDNDSTNLALPRFLPSLRPILTKLNQQLGFGSL